MAFRAAFEQTKEEDKSSDESSDSSSDEDFARYPAPLNDLYEGSSSPGAGGHERGMYDRTARYLRGFYDPDSDDEFLPHEWKEIYRQRPKKTPKRQGTLKSYKARVRGERAKEILNQNRKTKNYPELTTEEFARVQRKQRLTKEQRIERLKKIYGPPNKRTTRRERLQLRL